MDYITAMMKFHEGHKGTPFEDDCEFLGKAAAKIGEARVSLTAMDSSKNKKITHWLRTLIILENAILNDEYANYGPTA